MRVSLMPEQEATIEDVSGGSVTLTCGAGAMQMIVERKPERLDAAQAQ